MWALVHLPYLPQQIAQLLVHRRKDATIELLHSRDTATMSLEMQEEAVELATATSRNHARASWPHRGRLVQPVTTLLTQRNARKEWRILARIRDCVHGS